MMIEKQKKYGKLTIQLSSGARFRFEENNEGYLVINKTDIDNGSGIIIEPSVSNEIRIK